MTLFGHMYLSLAGASHGPNVSQSQSPSHSHSQRPGQGYSHSPSHSHAIIGTIVIANFLEKTVRI